MWHRTRCPRLVDVTVASFIKSVLHMTAFCITCFIFLVCTRTVKGTATCCKGGQQQPRHSSSRCYSTGSGQPEGLVWHWLWLPVTAMRTGNCVVLYTWCIGKHSLLFSIISQTGVHVKRRERIIVTRTLEIRPVWTFVERIPCVLAVW